MGAKPCGQSRLGGRALRLEQARWLSVRLDQTRGPFKQTQFYNFFQTPTFSSMGQVRLTQRGPSTAAEQARGPSAAARGPIVVARRPSAAARFLNHELINKLNQFFLSHQAFCNQAFFSLGFLSLRSFVIKSFVIINSFCFQDFCTHSFSRGYKWTKNAHIIVFFMFHLKRHHFWRFCPQKVFT